MTTPSRLLDELKGWLQDNSIIASAANNVRVVVLSDLTAYINRLSPTHGGDGVTTETNCPTCGSAVKVGGDGETHYYIPITRPAQPEGWPEWLLEIGHKLRTQDNRITADPLFCVFQKRRIWGMDPDYAEQSVWLDKDSDRCEVDESEVELDEFGDPVKDNYEKAHYIEIDEFVTAHLTEEAALHHIRINGHNLKKPFTYVTSQFRCPEYIQLREWIKSLPTPPAKGGDTGETEL